jgi:hypothetical protein
MQKAKGQFKPSGSCGAPRFKLTATESLKRMQDFSKRKEAFIATVRKGKDRNQSV